MQTIRTT